MQTQPRTAASQHTAWIPLTTSLGLLLRRRQLLGWSVLLIVAMALLTLLGYRLSLGLIETQTADWFTFPGEPETLLGKAGSWGLLAAGWLFGLITHLVTFYLAFLLAYTITTPGYVYLSTAAEKLHAGEEYEGDDHFTFGGFFRDLYEGLKIGLFGVLVTGVAIFVNFIPAIGQGAVLLLYIFYAALMFIDYPASRRRWPLGRKLRWLREHHTAALRLGLLPALLSMIPLLNIFFIALVFPLLTIHATLNFSAVELSRSAATGAGPLVGKGAGSRADDRLIR